MRKRTPGNHSRNFLRPQDARLLAPILGRAFNHCFHHAVLAQLNGSTHSHRYRISRAAAPRPALPHPPRPPKASCVRQFPLCDEPYSSPGTGRGKRGTIYASSRALDPPGPGISRLLPIPTRIPDQVCWRTQLPQSGLDLFTPCLNMTVHYLGDSSIPMSAGVRPQGHFGFARCRSPIYFSGINRMRKPGVEAASGMPFTPVGFCRAM
jgi:hypothetical protein